MRIIKSLEYNRDEYLLLYWCFLRRRRCPQVSVHALTSGQPFGFLSFWQQDSATDYRTIFRSIFLVTLTLNFRVRHRFFTSQPKNNPIATKQIANISIEHWASNMTSVVTLILELSKSIMEFAILQQKWPDCNEMKSKHIDLTSGLKYVEFDLGHDHDLAFSRSKFLFVIPYYLIPGYEIVGFEQCVIMRPRSHMLIVRRKIEPVKTSDYFIFLGVIDNVAFW